MRSSSFHTAFAALAATLVLFAGVRARAAPPTDPGVEPVADPAAPQTDPGVEPVVDPAPEPPPPPLHLWLSLELIGPRGAQIDAAEALRVAPIVDALPRGGSPPPGELVGRVDSLAEALAWVGQQAFDQGGGSPASTAPLPGGALLRDHGVHLTALVLTAASDSGGTRPYAWPSAAELPTPASWIPASLVVARAPMFAAPSDALPPASERYRVVAFDDAVWLLGLLDRCSAAGACLRWAQVLVREGDRWFGGWVPAAQVVADRDWVPGPDGRRFALVASHRDRATVGYALIEQRGDQRVPAVGLRQAYAGASWPAASVQVLDDQLVVVINGVPASTVTLEPSPATPLSPG